MKDNGGRGLMKDGLIRLLKVKRFVEISVTDLVKESHISRASFYRFYNNLEQVLEDIVIDVKYKFTTKILPYIMEKDESGIVRMIKQFFLAVKEKRFQVFETLPENRVIIMSKIEQTARYYDDSEKSMAERYLVPVFFSSIITIARTWERYGYIEDPEELANFAFDAFYKKYMTKASD